MKKNRVMLFKVCYSIFIFGSIFFLLGFAVDKIWFREDDLGTILNGLIYNLHDFIRVFSTDCRSFITTVNYTRTAPNVISGFLRPMQNVFFSLVHWFCGTNANAYFLLHVALHAVNATLFFWISSIFMPASFACGASLLLALYPDVSWLMWIATVQNSLTLFFVLLSVLSFYLFRRKRLQRWYIISGCMFLFSIFSRENTIFLPLWFLGGALSLPYLFDATDENTFCCGWYEAIKQAFAKTWIYFASLFIYVFVRLFAFGFATLPRTLSRLLLLAQQTRMSPAFLAQGCNVVSQVPSSSQQPFWHFIMYQICHLGVFVQNQMRAWCEVFLKFSPRTYLGWSTFITLSIFLIMFLLYAYKEKRAILWWLLTGIVFLGWPGVVTYPNARYLNVVFPLFVFIFAYGFFLVYERRDKYGRSIFLPGILGISCFLLFVGVQDNRKNLYQTGLERYNYKARFDAFFSAYDVSKIKRFIFLSSPFISDIHKPVHLSLIHI